MITQTPLSNRLTIGFLIDHTDSQYQFGILQGVSDFAKHRNVNLICLEGGPLNSREHFKYDRNILYGLAGGNRLDGLIVLSDSVAIQLDDNALYQFRESFQPLPVIFVGRSHPKVPSIVIDSFSGMKEMVTHLIEKHGYRSFGFIKGLAGSFHAEVRYTAFVEALTEHNIVIDEDLVYEGDFLEISGTLAVKYMLDTHKKKPEVIVSCNDEMAISALHELKRRGIRTPEDVAVVGVDDIPKCATTTPPMTSVRQPLLREGWTAISLMVDILECKVSPEKTATAVPMITSLDSRLIVRESCGCTISQKSSFRSSSISELSRGKKTDPGPSIELCQSQIESILRSISYDRNWKSETSLASSLMDSYIKAVRTRKTDVFLDLWRDFLNMNFHLEVDEVTISGIMQHLSSCKSSKDSTLISDNLFWAATGTLEKRTLQQIRKTYNIVMREEFVLNQLRDQLDIRFDRAKILDILHHNLVELGIQSAYMSMYDQSENPGIARMVLAYLGDTRYLLPENGLEFPAESLIPDIFFNYQERFSFMVEALYYGEQQIGFLILDMSRHIDSIHADIRRIVSNIFRSIDLVNKIQHQKTELVNSLDKLKETLEGIIKTLSITVENRDPYTAGHQRRVADLSMAIGREMMLDDNQLEEIRVAALLHDIGKIFTPAEILNKPGALKSIEFELIKQHAEEGYNTLKNIKFPWPIAEIVYQHHERCDGSGYPRRLIQNEILLAARILSVADVVEAITSMRPYRAALGLDVAIGEITRFKGSRYDEDVVNAAIRLFQTEGFKMPEPHVASK
jgi:putative nucleotidyltransferase with HDIG domain